VVLFGLHEGFQNMPKMYGSDVRESGKITNFGSGVSEGVAVRSCAACLNVTETDGVIKGPFLWVLRRDYRIV
jgi:hypothetical protein